MNKGIVLFYAASLPHHPLTITQVNYISHPHHHHLGHGVTEASKGFFSWPVLAASSQPKLYPFLSLDFSAASLRLQNVRGDRERDGRWGDGFRYLGVARPYEGVIKPSLWPPDEGWVAKVGPQLMCAPCQSRPAPSPVRLVTDTCRRRRRRRPPRRGPSRSLPRHVPVPHSGGPLL
ncbi:hypothetical protein B296_00021941 [Ensete ventricosum]|uniref:Uncharacterized protein n=1 Tax=Ensete ventricosum TaxID=4639 RepID=A0A426YIK6_ENSVE|nr:hypothetical protein B296_00021941 [Ensete ventricosum]